jgi:hypothetical protein
MKIKKPKYSWQIYRNYKFNLIPNIVKDGLMWKDKFETPRCEKPPTLKIAWLFWEYYGSWGSDEYWEQRLWLEEYCNNDYKKAVETWGWVDMDTEKSTWDDKLLKHEK